MSVNVSFTSDRLLTPHHSEKLLLHRPYSQLQYHSTESASRCTPNAQTRDSRKSVELHTIKTLEAVEDAFRLFALPSAYPRHSPIVTCSLALFIMAQVSACTNIYRPGDKNHADGRQRIRLGLGFLKVCKTCWRTAQRSENEVRALAKQLLMSDVPHHAGNRNDNGAVSTTASEESGAPS